MSEEAIASGTRAPASAGDTQPAAWVQGMFAGIAQRYDLLNHLLSFNIDRGWRRALERELAPLLGDPRATVLDLCCGTGDLLIELTAKGPARVVGANFCRPMLDAAQRKIAARGFTNSLLEADALTLPFADSCVDAVAVAFGFRNLADYRCGLDELLRVLKPGGILAILEFSHPRHAWLRALYGGYSTLLLPLVGWLVSGSRQAYSYLPESIRRFPRAPQLAMLMGEAGFLGARYRLLTGGIAALHVASKSPAA